MIINFNKIKKAVLSGIMAMLMLILNCMPVFAVEDVDYVMVEFQEKKEAGLEVYELTDQYGNMAGYYEPFSDTNPEPASPRYTSTINWTISGNHNVVGVNRYTLGEGSKIYVKISQSKTGSSTLGLYNQDEDHRYWFPKTTTTDGWSGTITLSSNISTGVYGFAIKNESSDSITYTGYYTL